MRVRALLFTVATLGGCSAISDFDYRFTVNDDRDAGGDGGRVIDIDATMSVDGSFGPDGALDAAGDAGCGSGYCCEITEVNELSCGDGLDNDCDGLGDCADPDCLQSVVCCPNPALESGDTACTDGIDNDCDGTKDCDEDGCKDIYKCTCRPIGPEDGVAYPARCIGGKDEDCDGLVDCDDNGCNPATVCCMRTPGQETVETSCSDGLNNDCDVAGADCADPDCRMSTDAGMAVAHETGSACLDTRDNDCDGLTDCKDPDCSGLLLCCIKTLGQESTETSCKDGINNDCDSAGADCFDPDCKEAMNCCLTATGGEKSQAACSNKVDDDCDTHVDCADSDCRQYVSCCPTVLGNAKMTIQTTETSCTDGYDNDCDGLVDCNDTVDCPPLTCRRIILGDPPIVITQPIVTQPVNTVSQ